MRRAKIDALRSPQGGLGRRAIQQILPYGDDFLFVDSISELTTEHACASYRIPKDSAAINAHLTHAPIMPGVLLAEAMAQAGIVLAHYHADFANPTDVLASSVRNMRFKSAALPGECLEQQVKLLAINSAGARIEGKTQIAQRLVCTATFDVSFAARAQLIEQLQKLQQQTKT